MTLKVIVVAVFATCLLSLAPSISIALERGDDAPLFRADSTAGLVSLSDFAGDKFVVLALYIAIFTPV